MFSAASANPLAFLALLSVFPIAYILFGRYRPAVAGSILIIGSCMFLPQQVGFDLPGLPKLGKEPLPYIAILLMLLLRDSRRLGVTRFGAGREWLGIVMIVGILGTVFTNMDNVVYGARVLRGLSVLEYPTAALEELLRFAIPFYVGRLLIRDSRDLRDLLTVLACAGLLYSIIVLLEIRLSPQFHRWTYGFHPNIFSTAIRWGGYRPMAYMPSGIALAVFMVTTLIAAATLRRARLPVVPFRGIPFSGTISRFASPYLVFAITISKSVASIVWAWVFALIIPLLSLRNLTRIGLLGAILVTTYPMLRLTHLFPVERIVSTFASAVEDRADSLNYRFTNEENMLVRTRQRPIFGWGGYQRNWALDQETGDWLTVPDGFWIIQFSAYGVVGLLSAYMLYVVPVVRAWWRLDRIPRLQDRTLIVGLALIVIVRAVDQLPNGFYTSYPLFIAGALDELLTTLPAAAARARRRREARELDEPPMPPDVPAPVRDPEHVVAPSVSAGAAILRRERD